MKNRFIKIIKSKYFSIFIGILLLILVWEIISLSSSSIVFPEFFKTLSNTFNLITNKDVMYSLGLSILRIVITLFISLILGYLLGSISGFIPKIGEVMKPIIYLLTCFPTACMIYILIIYTKVTCYVLVGVLTFPLIYKACYIGSSSIVNKYYQTITLSGRYKLNNFTKIILPLNLPYLGLGLLQTSGLALKGEIMGEVFMGDTTYKGIGILIRKAATVDYNIDNLFSLTLLAIITMSLLDLIVHIIKSRVLSKYNLEDIKLYQYTF